MGAFFWMVYMGIYGGSGVTNVTVTPSADVLGTLALNQRILHTSTQGHQLLTTQARRATL